VHPAGLKSYITGLIEQGITEQEIDIMLRRNPARLLDLD
jgi:predicted metal-dependent phosphotriesterase family hydrolase